MILDEGKRQSKPLVDQAKNSLLADLTNEEPTTPSPADASPKQLRFAVAKKFSHPKKRAPAITRMDLCTSRGSAMLKAALADRSAQSNKPSRDNIQQDVTDLVTRHQLHQIKYHRLHQSCDDLRNDVTPPKRRRSLANRVLFANPVVTRAFEYEQTVLHESLVCDSKPLIVAGNLDRRNASDLVNSFEKAELKSLDLGKSELKKRRDEKVNAKLDASYSSSQDLARRTRNSDSQTYSTQKSNYQIHGLDEDVASDASTNSSELHESNEGLFSSPKVAKIAPYSQFDVKDLNDSSNESFEIVKERNEVDSNQETYPVLPLHIKDSISFDPEIVTRDDSISDSGVITCRGMESESLGYLSWITHGLSYLTSKFALNKLIY